MQYNTPHLNKSQNSHLAHKISNKKGNLNGNHDNGRDCQVQKIKSDNTFYSPVKYFSNNLQAHQSKYEQDDISPWQTNNEDQLNSSGIDFRYKKVTKKEQKREQNVEEKEQNILHTPQNSKIIQSYNIFSNGNNIDTSYSQISKTVYDNDLKKRKQSNIQSQESNKRSENEDKKEIPMKDIEKGNDDESNSQEHDHKKDNISGQQSLGQLEIEQQNQLLASIRRQKALYIQQLQKKKQYSEELSKTAVMTTPKKVYSQNEYLHFIHRKNSSYSSTNKSTNVIPLLSAQSQFDQQQQKLHYHQQMQNHSTNIMQTEGNTSYNEENIRINNVLPNQKLPDESITVKNKNRILSILDNALNNQKRLIKVKETSSSQNNPNSFYSISHKASMIQRNLDTSGSTKLKLSEQYQQSYQNSKNFTNSYNQKSNLTLQNSQVDEANIFLRRQSKTQDPNLQITLKGYSCEDEGENNNVNNCQRSNNQFILESDKESTINQDIEKKLFLSSNLSDKKSAIQSYILGQQRAGITSNELQFPPEHFQNGLQINACEDLNDKFNLSANKNSFEKLYEFGNSQIDKKNQTSYNKKQSNLLNKENHRLHRQDTLEDQYDDNTTLKQSEITQNQSQKNVSMLLPLFKGKNTSKEYKRVIKRIQRMQNTSPSQRRNTDHNNIDNVSFNTKNEYNINLTEESCQDYKMLENSTPQQTQLPPISQELPNRKKHSHSFLMDSSNILAPRPLLYQGVSKINYISPNKIITSYQALNENSTYMPQLSKEIYINDSQNPLISEESINQPSYEQVVRNFNQNISKAINIPLPDKSYISTSTPKRQGIEASKSQPHSSVMRNNIQHQKQAELSTKKQKELISYYKPSQLLSSVPHSYPQQINISNLSHSKIL